MDCDRNLYYAMGKVWFEDEDECNEEINESEIEDGVQYYERVVSKYYYPVSYCPNSKKCIMDKTAEPIETHTDYTGSKYDDEDDEYEWNEDGVWMFYDDKQIDRSDYKLGNIPDDVMDSLHLRR
jgi:hypothetical protein